MQMFALLYIQKRAEPVGQDPYMHEINKQLDPFGMHEIKLTITTNGYIFLGNKNCNKNTLRSIYFLSKTEGNMHKLALLYIQKEQNPCVRTCGVGTVGQDP